jgi:hypothetical protein
MCESGANFLCVHYRLKISLVKLATPFKNEKYKEDLQYSVSLFYSRCICFFSDPETFAANQQGGNIQSSSRVRNIQGQDMLSNYLCITESVYLTVFVIIWRHQYIQVRILDVYSYLTLRNKVC